MKQPLSQQEIDKLFHGGGDVLSTEEVGAVPFDFRRLDRIPKSQVSAIHLMHESFVRVVSSSLSVFLRSFVSGTLISVEQLPYSDFVEALSTPTVIVYMSLDPYEGHAVVEVSPALMGPILDLVLGGSGKSQTELDREITEVEKNLLEGFFQIISNDLRETWKPVVELSFAYGAIETSSQMSGRFVPTEAVVAIAMELRVGETSGIVNLAIPSITLKTLGQRFDQQWAGHRTENPAIESAIMRKLARELQVTAACEYSKDTIRMQDLLNLSSGDILALGRGFDETVDVLVNGVSKFKGSLGVSNRGLRTVMLE